MWGVGGTLASMDHFTISAKQLPNLSLLNTCQHLSDLLVVLNNHFAGPRTKQKEKQHKAKMCRGWDQGGAFEDLFIKFKGGLSQFWRWQD